MRLAHVLPGGVACIFIFLLRAKALSLCDTGAGHDLQGKLGGQAEFQCVSV